MFMCYLFRGWGWAGGFGLGFFEGWDLEEVRLWSSGKRLIFSTEKCGSSLTSSSALSISGSQALILKLK